MLWSTPLIPAHRRQSWVDLCEIKGNLVYIVSSRSTDATGWPCLKKTKNKIIIICMYVLGYMEKGQGSMLRIFLPSFFFLEDSVFHWTKSSLIGVDWLASKTLDPHVSASPCWGDRRTWQYLAFSVGAGNPNSGHHACTANCLPTQPPSWPLSKALLPLHMPPLHSVKC